MHKLDVAILVTFKYQRTLFLIGGINVLKSNLFEYLKILFIELSEYL